LINNYSFGMKLGLAPAAEAVSDSSSSRDGGGIGLSRYGFHIFLLSSHR
jgi:hypothetical protein